MDVHISFRLTKAEQEHHQKVVKAEIWFLPKTFENLLKDYFLHYDLIFETKKIHTMRPIMF